MDRTNQNILEVMRAMAWQRAKGELKSMLETFYPEYDQFGNYISGKFMKLDEEVDKFVSIVEDEELHL